MEVKDTCTKACTKCKMELPIEYFHLAKELKSGRTGACKSCLNAQAKAYRDMLKEQRGKGVVVKCRMANGDTTAKGLEPSRYGEAQRERDANERYWIEQERMKYPKARIARPLSQQIA